MITKRYGSAIYSTIFRYVSSMKSGIIHYHYVFSKRFKVCTNIIIGAVNALIKAIKYKQHLSIKTIHDLRSKVF